MLEYKKEYKAFLKFKNRISQDKTVNIEYYCGCALNARNINYFDKPSFFYWSLCYAFLKDLAKKRK